MNKTESNSFIKNISKLGKLDLILFSSVVLLNGMGLVSINSVAQVAGSNTILVRQTLGSVIGIILMTLLSLVDTGRITKYWKILYAITVIALLCVLFFGTSGGGARRWITLGGLTFQPSELAKILLILFYSEFIINFDGKYSRTLVFALSTLLILPPFFMILREPDLSTSIMIFLIFCVIIFTAGLDHEQRKPVSLGDPAASIRKLKHFIKFGTDAWIFDHEVVLSGSVSAYLFDRERTVEQFFQYKRSGVERSFVFRAEDRPFPGNIARVIGYGCQLRYPAMPRGIDHRT